MKDYQFRGYLFEYIIKRFVEFSNFTLIDSNDVSPQSNAIRMNKANFCEVKGRGEYHQIDVLADFLSIVPFSYPIRLYGEVKFHKNPIEKNTIRELIGVKKDIDENFIVENKLTSEQKLFKRQNIFAIFSASGVSNSAENLCFAHDIKVISYENNKTIELIKNTIYELTNIVYGVTFSGSSIDKSDVLKQIVLYFDSNQNLLDSILQTPCETINSELENIKASFFGITATGEILHFTSNEEFPYEEFKENDRVSCKVKAENNNYWFIEVGSSQSKFYFSPPNSLLESRTINTKDLTIALEKSDIFKTILVHICIGGIRRNLELVFDHKWFQGLKENVKSKHE